MKYLLVDNEVIARRKSSDALELDSPNWRIDQQALHDSDPARYPHPNNCGQYLNGWQRDELGRCEIEMPDGHAKHYPDDNPGKITNVRALQAVEK